MIHKITPSVDYNHWLKRLNIQPHNKTNKISLKPLTLLSKRLRKHYYKTYISSEAQKKV